MLMRALLFALLCLCGLSTGVAASEAILRFTSEATVNTDASLDVIETIVVNAEGQEIKRGILRDFPTTYTDKRGIKVRVGFDVTRVERDGQSETFAMESLSNGKRIRIGNKDVFLNYGQHTYRIFYTTTRQLGFFDDFDELYWNVTGNGWSMPIHQATAVINLPSGAAIQNSAIYTGSFGATEKNAEILTAQGNRFRAVTTQTLNPGEGFTVAVAWQKGIVTAPTAADKQADFIRDNAGLFALMATLAFAALYYLYAWNKVGRDPPGGTIIPLFQPPANIGPAGVRFIWKQGFDNRAFAAAIVGLAVKGYAIIEDDGDDFAITKKSGNVASSLTASESALYQALPNGTLNLQQANHAAIQRGLSAIRNALKKEYDGAMFVKNFRWFFLGAVVSIAGLVIAALLMNSEEGILGLFMAGWSAIWWGVVLGIGWAAVRGAINGSGVFNRIASVGKLFFMIPFAFAGVGMPAAFMLSSDYSPMLIWIIATAVVLGLMNLLFYHLLKAPTPTGRRVLDQIEGFRMYMETAEEERLKILHPPEKTPALFEKYLPYALALDCENQWNAKFATVLAAAAVAGAAAPVWYHGNNWDAGRSGDFTDRLGSSLTSSISSSSTAPGSSSGSSGGGSSGGGGGGGGGSGW